MKISEYIAKNGSRFAPSEAREIVDLVRQSILADNLEFSTELELQDLIYAETHSVYYTAMAKEIFEKYLRRQATSNWNSKTCPEITDVGGYIHV